MKKTVLSRIFSFILAFLLTVTLLGGCLCLCARSTVGEPGRIRNAVEKSGFVTVLLGEIKDKWDNLLSISGIPDTKEMLSLLTEEKLAADVQVYFDGAYKGELNVDTQPLETALRQKLDDYIAGIKNADPQDKDLQKNMTDLISACADEYRQSVRVPMLHTVLGKVTRLNTVLLWGGVGLFLFSALLILFLFFLQQQRRDTLYFTGISAFAVTVVTLGGSLWAKAADLVNRLPLAQSALRELAKVYVADLLHVLTLWGVAFAAATVLLLIAYFLTKGKKSSAPAE